MTTKEFITKYPDLVKEWHPTKNPPLNPDQPKFDGHQKVWWVCKEGHDPWSAEIWNRINGSKCPYCTGRLPISGVTDFASRFPEIAAEWDYSLNVDKKPPHLQLPFSNIKVYWRCKTCGYGWGPISIESRTKDHTGCPACAGKVVFSGFNDLQAKFPDIASEWHPTLNGIKHPNEVFPFCNTEYWWSCKFGHDPYRCRVADRTRKGTGCPECKKLLRTSFPEQCIYYYIKKAYPNAINGYKADFLKKSELDVYIPEISTGIEYDGQRFHTEHKLADDIKKDLECHDHKIVLIRVREPKCPIMQRDDPTYVLESLSLVSLEKAINLLLKKLGIQTINASIMADLQDIASSFSRHTVPDNLRDKDPLLAKEWNYEKNGGLRPENVRYLKSRVPYWWKCPNCGYEWPAPLHRRIAGDGCAVCSKRIVVPGINDLLTTNPLLAAEWHPSKNEKPVEQVSKYADYVAWWKCAVCGHEWPKQVKARANGDGCPKCSGRLKKAILQYSIDGEFIRRYNTVKEAGEAVGVSRSAIGHALNKPGSTSGGFVWKYED